MFQKTTANSFQINSFGRSVLVFLFILFLTGCQSGTWENDPKNWERAFDSTPPSEITIVNSWYWRSVHFTLEFEYFFEIIVPNELRQELIFYNDFQKVDSIENIDLNFSKNKPKWFVPKEMSAYDIYGSAEIHDNFKIFIDRETGHIFLTDNVF